MWGSNYFALGKAEKYKIEANVQQSLPVLLFWGNLFVPFLFDNIKVLNLGMKTGTRRLTTDRLHIAITLPRSRYETESGTCLLM